MSAHEALVIRADRAFTAGPEETVDDAGVVVAAGRIAAVAPFARVRVPGGARVIELGDRTLLPGLIDAHAHVCGRRTYGSWEELQTPRELLALRAAEDCAKLLRAGFTTVRDCGGTIPFALQPAIEEGAVPGPRLVAAGPMISQTGGHADEHSLDWHAARQLPDGLIVDGPDECRQAVRRAVRAGASFIKICTTGGIGSERDEPDDEHFTRAEIEAIVDEAHRLRRRVASHAQGKGGILNAVRAGVDCIEHAYWLDEECVDEMERRGTHLVPTLYLVEVFERALSDPTGMPSWRLRKQPPAIGAMKAAFALARESRLTIAAGPDSFGPPGRAHGDNADEAITMASHGMPAAAALRAATIGGATVLGSEGEIGSLEAGKRADVIAVAGDPTSDIRALRRVELVMRAGALHSVPGDGEPARP